MTLKIIQIEFLCHDIFLLVINEIATIFVQLWLNYWHIWNTLLFFLLAEATSNVNRLRVQGFLRDRFLLVDSGDQGVIFGGGGGVFFVLINVLLSHNLFLNIFSLVILLIQLSQLIHRININIQIIHRNWFSPGKTVLIILSFLYFLIHFHYFFLMDRSLGCPWEYFGRYRLMTTLFKNVNRFFKFISDILVAVRMGIYGHSKL